MSVFNTIKLNLLLKNPILEQYTKEVVVSDIINNFLGMSLKLPQKHNALPFIFSCFALSLDGKLCYPDLDSGFTISQFAHLASAAEKTADWYSLMLARTISDAVIVGANSLRIEGGKYTPEIFIPELLNSRVANGLPAIPWCIVVCRDINKLDFTSPLFTNQKYPLIIAVNSMEITPISTKNNFQTLKLSELNNMSQLANKNILYLDDNLTDFVLHLRRIGFTCILNESPMFNHKLLEHKLLDELWINYAGSYIGGDVIGLGVSQQSFTTNSNIGFEMLTLHHIAYSFLYTRQRVVYTHPL